MCHDLLRSSGAGPNHGALRKIHRDSRLIIVYNRVKWERSLREHSDREALFLKQYEVNKFTTVWSGVSRFFSLYSFLAERPVILLFNGVSSGWVVIIAKGALPVYFLVGETGAETKLWHKSIWERFDLVPGTTIFCFRVALTMITLVNCWSCRATS